MGSEVGDATLSQRQFNFPYFITPVVISTSPRVDSLRRTLETRPSCLGSGIRFLGRWTNLRSSHVSSGRGRGCGSACGFLEDHGPVRARENHGRTAWLPGVWPSGRRVGANRLIHFCANPERQEITGASIVMSAKPGRSPSVATIGCDIQPRSCPLARNLRPRRPLN